jgi:hypothetical protein
MADETLTELIEQIETKFGVRITIDDELPPLLTNAAGVEFIQKKVGLPVPQSRFDKDKMTGRVPPPDVFYGRVELRKPVTWLQYVMTLLSSEPVRLAGSRAGRLDVEADRGT